MDELMMQALRALVPGGSLADRVAAYEQIKILGPEILKPWTLLVRDYGEDFPAADMLAKLADMPHLPQVLKNTTKEWRKANTLAYLPNDVPLAMFSLCVKELGMTSRDVLECHQRLPSGSNRTAVIRCIQAARSAHPGFKVAELAGVDFYPAALEFEKVKSDDVYGVLYELNSRDCALCRENVCCSRDGCEDRPQTMRRYRCFGAWHLCVGCHAPIRFARSSVNLKRELGTAEFRCLRGCEVSVDGVVLDFTGLRVSAPDHDVDKADELYLATRHYAGRQERRIYDGGYRSWAVQKIKFRYTMDATIQRVRGERQYRGLDGKLWRVERRGNRLFLNDQPAGWFALGTRWFCAWAETPASTKSRDARVLLAGRGKHTTDVALISDDPPTS